MILTYQNLGIACKIFLYVYFSFYLVIIFQVVQNIAWKRCMERTSEKNWAIVWKKYKNLSLSLFLLNIMNWRAGKTIVDLYILPCHENNYLCNNDAEQIKSFIEPSNATAIYLLRKEKNVWQLMFIYKYVAKCNTAVQQISIFGYKFFLVFHTRMNIWPVFQFPLFISLAS